MESIARLYGIRQAAVSARRNQPVLAVQPQHTNWGGTAHGGCFILLSTLACQNVSHETTYGGTYTYHFLRSVPVGDTMTASAKVTKAGRVLLCAQADIMSEGRLVGFMTADSILKSAQVTNIADRQTGQTPPPIDCLMPTLTKDSTTRERRLLGCMGSKETFFSRPHENVSCVGLATNEDYTDSSGWLDDAIFGCLADNSLGLTCCSRGIDCVTTCLTVTILKKARPGALLRCNAEVVLESGPFLTACGTLWADNRIVGTCEGTFYGFQPQ